MAFKFNLWEKLLRFEKAENDYIKKQKEVNEEIDRLNSDERMVSATPVFASGGKFDMSIWIISWFLAPFNKSHREKIQCYLPLALEFKNNNPEDLRSALENLHKYSDDEISVITDKLLFGSKIYEKREIIFKVVVILIIVLVLLFKFVF